MTTDLAPFDAHATCPKCGHDDVGSTYQSPCRDAGCRMEKHRERIDRNCRRCRFEWPESPLDRQAAR